MHTCKKWAFAGMLLFFLCQCSSSRQVRERELSEWISNAAKPLRVIRHNPNNHVTATRGSHFYTLIDQKGQVYLAKNVRYVLPEQIP
jgi:succinylglutamate desuccinylase